MPNWRPRQNSQKFKPHAHTSSCTNMTTKAKAGNRRRCYRWRAKNPSKYREYQKRLMRERRAARK